MGRLNDILKQLQWELDRDHVKETKPSRISRVFLKRLIKDNDHTLLEEKANRAIGNHRRQTQAGIKDMLVRKAHPGRFYVVFINRHTGERLRLTLENGVFYDIALNYFNYITEYGTAVCTEMGRYEIIEKKEEAFLPEEDHFGI